MNAGNLATSKRLQDTLQVLSAGGMWSTRAISTFTGSMAVHSDISALRANGIDIETQRDGKRYYYRVKGER
jgi:hypothetical protein